MAFPSFDDSAMVSPDLLLGSFVDNRYRLDHLIGEGSFGTVFAAEEVLLGQTIGWVAVKVVRLTAEKNRSATLREVQLLAGLRHPHILGYRSAGEITSGPATNSVYIALELADASLQAILDEGRQLKVYEARRLALEIASALSYLRSRGAVHRDVKPANLLHASGSWKLGDLGLARLAGEGQMRASGVKGTVAYLSPEACRGDTGPPVDMWALGVLLQESLTGRLPFSADSHGEYVARIISQSPTIVPDLPGPFEAVVQGCLQPDPKHRWTPGQVIEALSKGLPAQFPPADISPRRSNLPIIGQETLLEAPASAAPKSAHPAPHLVVSSRGDGDYLTISEAIQAAPPGVTIVVRAGVYREGLVIDRPVEIVGDGPVETVRVESVGTNCVRMTADSATVRGMTLAGQASAEGRRTYAVNVLRGQLLLDECVITSKSLACVAVHGPTAEPIIRQCQIRDGAEGGLYFYDSARGSVEGCIIAGHARAGLQIKGGSGPYLWRCQVERCTGGGLLAGEAARLVAEECQFLNNGRFGVAVAAADVTLRKCAVRHNALYGVSAREGAEVTAEDCDLSCNTYGAWDVASGCRVTRRSNKESQGD